MKSHAVVLVSVRGKFLDSEKGLNLTKRG